MKVTSFGKEYDLQEIASGKYKEQIGERVVTICVEPEELASLREATDAYIMQDEPRTSVISKSLVREYNPSDYMMIFIAGVRFFIYSVRRGISIHELKLD